MGSDAGRFSRRGFLKGLSAVAGATTVVSHDASAQEAPPPPDGPAVLRSVPVTLTVNGGEAQTLEVHPDHTAIEVVRDTLKLTGCKQACGHGACGACTMLVDGTPMVSCLLPASALDQTALTTIEGIGPAWRPAPVEGEDAVDTAPEAKDAPPPAPTTDGLHPVQRAFLANDALQCGFCTPGFIVEAAAFHDLWRETNGTAEPSRDAIADALEGHLCRCGAYASIYAAVAAACKGEHDGILEEWPRQDGRPKVTGKAEYTVDVARGGMLEGAVLRSPFAHAVLTSLDTEAALNVPGVQAVVRYVTDGGLVRYHGQEVAAVAAKDRFAAAAGLRALAPDWNVKKHTVGWQGRKADSAPVYPDNTTLKKEGVAASEGPAPGGKLSNNLRGPMNGSQFAKPGAAAKRIDAARDGAGLLAEGTFETAAQVHTSLEPHAAVAEWTSSTALELWVSTQAVDHVADDVSKRYQLKRDDVRVHANFVGGAFGSKASLQMEAIMAIDLAKQAERPVRVVLERHDEMRVGGFRPAQQLEVAVAADSNGELLAIQSVGYGDSGVAVGHTTGTLMRIPYKSKFKDMSDYDVLNHGPPGKPFRAPGGPPGAFALEQLVDQVATMRAEDPIGLRRRWEENEPRLRLYDWAAKLPVWRTRGPRQADSGRYRRGVGLAVGGWFYILDPKTEVALEADKDGIRVMCACQDMGQGSKTVVAWAVADALGLPRRSVQVRFGDSSYPHGPLSGGSKTTTSVAPAAEDACAAFRKSLAKFAKDELDYSSVEIEPTQLVTNEGPLSFQEVLDQGARVSVVGQRKRDPGGYLVPITLGGNKIGKGFPGAVQITHVEVDTRLGGVRVLETWIGIGAGRIRVPPLARSQVEGGVVQGIGYALFEERRVDVGTGRILTLGLEDYKLPGLGDTPPIHVHFEERGFEGALAGGAGLAELCTIPTAGSIANAVAHATGWRPRSLPLRPDRVLAGLGGVV
ncbi:MAG: xanthine dehydrogenase YagR molybdenum-binding subunit [Myxococcota bacterium]|jgi:xanthine dehydrogenase YagR molybdenum-binding subunit